MPSTFRRDWITKPIFRLAQHALPRLSDTEREAIEAGDVWWDAELFTGNPDWKKLSGLRARQIVRRRSKRFWPARSKSCAAWSTTGRSIGNGGTCRRRSGIF